MSTLSIVVRNVGFNTVKRLLGLSYLWTGSINGIKLQSKGDLAYSTLF